MLDRVLSSLVALSLALLVWLYARSRDQETLDNMPIPVQIALAPGQAEQYSLELLGPSQVPVSFTGPPARIREVRSMLQHGELQVKVMLRVPEERLNESRYQETVHIEAGDVHAPPGVASMIVDGHNRIPVSLYRLVERRLPVRLDHALEDRIGQTIVDPPTVLVRGPQETLDRLRAISTQPCVLPSRPEGAPANETLIVGPVPILKEIDGRAIRVTPATVMARLTLQTRKTYDLELPVRFLCPANLALRPRFIGDGRAGTVSVRVHGPAQAEPPAIFAFIDLTRGEFKPGLNHEPLQLQLPKEFQLAQDPPRLVAFELVSPETAARGLAIVPGP